jgi:hypothetical protein
MYIWPNEYNPPVRKYLQSQQRPPPTLIRWEKYRGSPCVDTYLPNNNNNNTSIKTKPLPRYIHTATHASPHHPLAFVGEKKRREIKTGNILDWDHGKKCLGTYWKHLMVGPYSRVRVDWFSGLGGAYFQLCTVSHACVHCAGLSVRADTAGG